MRILFGILGVILLLVSPAQADKRAFIVGVGEYDELTDLQKTVGDANGYSDVFETDLGFQVTRLIDPDLETFEIAFEAFVESIAPGDDVVFIFSGHGWSDGGDNFLALKDSPQQTSERMLKRFTVSLADQVLGDIKARKPGLLFTIIDACRDNPFDLGTRSMTRGLVRQELVRGTLVVYAAGERQKALDRLNPEDPSPYSVFTRSLLPKLKDPAKPLMISVDEARNEVAALAATIDHQQRPAVYSDISLKFCFSGQCNTGAPDIDQETRDWIYLSSGAYTAVDPCTKYANHLEKYPNGQFAARARTALENPPCAAPSRVLPSDVLLAQDDPDNWRAVDPENLLLFETSNGRVLIEMIPTLGRKHVDQMRQIARQGGWDGSEFYRVVAGFIVQGGRSEQTFPKIEAEFSRDIENINMIVKASKAGEGYFNGMPVGYREGSTGFLGGQIWAKHCPNTVFASTTSDPDSAETQFYINIRMAEHLDTRQTGWGRVIAGMDRVRSLEIGFPPENPDKIVRAVIAADLPDDERPIAYVQRPEGPEFQRGLGHASGQSVCEIPAIPARVAY